MLYIPPEIIAAVANFADLATLKKFRTSSPVAYHATKLAFLRALETFTRELDSTALDRADRMLSKPHPLQKHRDETGAVVVEAGATTGSLVKQMVIVMPFHNPIERSCDSDPRLPILAAQLTKILNHVPKCQIFRFLLPENASTDVATIAMEKASLTNKFVVFDRVPCDPRSASGEINLDILAGRNRRILDLYHRTVDDKHLAESHGYLIDYLLDAAYDVTVLSLDMKWDTVDTSAAGLISQMAKSVYYPRLEQLRIRAQAWREDDILTFVLKHKSTLERVDIDAAAGDGEEAYLLQLRNFLAGIKTTFLPPQSKGKSAQPACRPLQHFLIEFYVPKGDQLINRSIQWCLKDLGGEWVHERWIEAFQVMDTYIARGLAGLERGWDQDEESD